MSIFNSTMENLKKITAFQHSGVIRAERFTLKLKY
jgi:hypothetical protein